MRNFDQDTNWVQITEIYLDKDKDNRLFYLDEKTDKEYLLTHLFILKFDKNHVCLLKKVKFNNWVRY